MIELRNISHRYGRIDALRSVSAVAEPGRITAVLGPNAAGKTTLLRTVIGAITPEQGDVRIDGQHLNQLTPRQRAGLVAYVPQRSTVAAAFSVREIVELGRYALSANRQRIDQALQWLELDHLAERPYPSLSVGQQQRVTLARAVAQVEQDGCLVLDEPTAAMDLQHVSRTLGLLRRLANDGATVLLAIHDLVLAVNAADDVWLLDDGCLVVAGKADEVLTAAQLKETFGVEFVTLTDRRGRRFLHPSFITGA